MSLSFSLESNKAWAAPLGRKRRVLITGAAGRIGSDFAQRVHEKYFLRLMVRGAEPGIDEIRPLGEIVTADLTDLAQLKKSCQTIDTVVHLAASPDPSAVWSQLLPANIVGTYNLMVAAKSAGVGRVIFASSIHAVGGYPPDVQIKATDPVNPGDLYGVSKCFGEALGRYMAEQEGLSVISLRIGAFSFPEHMAKDEALAAADMFVSARDLAQLIELCIESTSIRWAVFNALSESRFKRLDITDARELLGYQPQDDFAQIFPKFKELNLNETLQTASLRDNYQKSGLRDDL